MVAVVPRPPLDANGETIGEREAKAFVLGDVEHACIIPYLAGAVKRCTHVFSERSMRLSVYKFDVLGTPVSSATRLYTGYL